MSPKREEDPRIVFPKGLGQELLRVAQERKHPESQLSPLLRVLAREWINQGTVRGREEGHQQISDRLAAVENQLRALSDALTDAPSPSVATQTRKANSDTLDNLARQVLDHLGRICDDVGVTPQVTAKEIAAAIGAFDKSVTMKRVRNRIDRLLALGMITVEQDSGGGCGRRYSIEDPGLGIL
jgi:DNA-binding transcriptional ArsR family regulator